MAGLEELTVLLAADEVRVVLIGGTDAREARRGRGRLPAANRPVWGLLTQREPPTAFRDQASLIQTTVVDRVAFCGAGIAVFDGQVEVAAGVSFGASWQEVSHRVVVRAGKIGMLLEDFQRCCALHDVRRV